MHAAEYLCILRYLKNTYFEEHLQTADSFFKRLLLEELLQYSVSQGKKWPKFHYFYRALIPQKNSQRVKPKSKMFATFS